MTKTDIDTIIKIICPNDEDFERPIISPAYLKKELEALALEQEPCEDAVSREAVLDALHVEGRPTKRFDYVIDVKNDIMSLPPVTPKQKTGKWIKYAAPRCGEQHYKCTNCNDYVNFGQFGDYYVKDFKFCPHCGAKMEGE